MTEGDDLPGTLRRHNRRDLGGGKHVPFFDLPGRDRVERAGLHGNPAARGRLAARLGFVRDVNHVWSPAVVEVGESQLVLHYLASMQATEGARAAIND